MKNLLSLILVGMLITSCVTPSIKYQQKGICTYSDENYSKFKIEYKCRIPNQTTYTKECVTFKGKYEVGKVYLLTIIN